LTNNDIFHLIISTFELDASAVIEIFSLADSIVTEEQVAGWLKKDEEAVAKLEATELALFLNGFINLKRGKREGDQPKPADYLNNNMVFQKLRIALNLKAEDILEVLKLADMTLSKHELSAFFRKPENKHYRECRDETLQNFLLGIQKQSEPSDDDLEAD